LLKLIATAIAAGSAVWGATTFLQSRADKGSVDKVSDEQVRIRIDQTVMSGKMERVEQSQERLERAVEKIGSKLDEPRRRR